MAAVAESSGESGPGLSCAAMTNAVSAAAVPCPDLTQDHARAHTLLVDRGYVQFYPQLAHLLGSFKPALMLGHALYWTRNWLREQPQRDGWFWKTAAEWLGATGLSQREQESARNELRKSGVWQERLVGAPARLHFRVDLGVLADRLGMPEGDVAVTNGDRLAAALGPPVMYFKCLADVAGGVAPGLVLSHTMAALRLATRTRELDARGFFPARVEEARIALGLGSKVQRNARDALKRAGFLQEMWTQERRPSLMVRLNVQAILACVGGQAEPQRRVRKARRNSGRVEPVPLQQALPLDRSTQASDLSKVTQVVRLLEAGKGSSNGPDGRRLLETSGLTSSTTDDGVFRHSRVAVLSNQQGLSGPKGCRFVETRVALLSKLYNKTEFTKPTTTPAGPRRPALHNATRSSRGTLDLPFESTSALVMPEGLDAALHAGAIQIVHQAPEAMRQPLLDELSGHLGLPRKTIANPLGWLQAIAKQACDGHIVLTMAPAVCAQRERRVERLRGGQSAEPQQSPVLSAPAASAATAQERAKLAKVREEIAARAGVTRMRRSPADVRGAPTGITAVHVQPHEAQGAILRTVPDGSGVTKTDTLSAGHGVPKTDTSSTEGGKR